MKCILGKKIEMRQVFEENGNVMPVTVVKAGPCAVRGLKTKEKNSYSALQLGFEEKKSGKQSGKKDRFLKEFRITENTESTGVEEEKTDGIKVGDVITSAIFQVGDVVKVVGFSKGRGFQGVVKRHGFHGQPASHGHKDQERMPGSIGSKRTGSVAPGKRMAGQMGNARVTVKNLKIIKIDLEKNELYLKGAVPGARNGLLMITAPGEMVMNTESTPPKT